MYKQNQMAKTTLKVNQSYEGERIEEKINRIVNNNEPITDGAPIIYTERKDGVQAGFNIRTDRFDVALDAMDIVSKQHLAKREQRAEMKIVRDDETKNDGEAKSTQGT